MLPGWLLLQDLLCRISFSAIRFLSLLYIMASLTRGLLLADSYDLWCCRSGQIDCPFWLGTTSA
ncbi:hypothetical protein OH77DRAFT_896007 [Trametes cingulata]|nr:hypothetical protein OH77DRAFT_896007 [Trametes cingulata]